MEMQQTPFQAAIKTGFIVGLIMLVANFLVYFVDYTLLASGWYATVIFVMFFGLILFFGFQYRKEVGGYLDFGKAFQFSFVTLIIAGIISIIGNIILYQVIDTDLPEVLADLQMENTMAIMDRFGAGDTIPVDAMDEMRNSMISNYTFIGQIKGFGFALIIYAILSLILGAIIKKKDKSLSY